MGIDRDGSRARAIATGVLAAALLALASTAQAQTPTPGPSTPAGPSATPGPSALASPSAAADPSVDLWFVAGDHLRRIDGRTGAVLATLPIDEPVCPLGPGFTGAATVTGGAIWIADNDADPPCLKGILVDGSDLRAFSLGSPEAGTLLIGDVLETPEGVWMIVATQDEEGALGGTALWRLDLVSGAIEQLSTDTTGLAAAGDTIGAFHQVSKKRGWLPGTLDPATGAFRPIKGATARTPRATGMVRAGGGRLLFLDPAGGPIEAYDPATKRLTTIAVPKNTAGTTAFASTDGVLMGGYRASNGAPYLRFQPWDGDARTIPDPCGDPVPEDCTSFAAGATPGGLWILTGPTPTQDGFDWSAATLRRLDPATLAVTLEVPGTVLVGEDAASATSPSPSPSAAAP